MKKLIDLCIKRMALLSLLLPVLLIVAGCAGIEPPNPNEMLRKPFGEGSIKTGMSKDQVISLWGKPDSIKIINEKEQWGGTKEVWVYNARFNSIPVNVQNLSQTKKLYFDGDNLMKVEE